MRCNEASERGWNCRAYADNRSLIHALLCCVHLVPECPQCCDAIGSYSGNIN